MSGSNANLRVQLGIDGASAVEGAFERLEAKLGTLSAQQRRHEQDVQIVQHAYEQGLISTDRYSQAIGALETRYAALTTSATSAAAAAREMAGAQDRAAAAQAEINRLLQVNTSGASFASRAADVAAYGAELDRLRAKFDPLFAASKRYEAALEEINRAEAAGAISARLAATAREQAASQLSGMATASDRASGAAGALTHQVQNASYQLGDFAVQVASGQSAVTALAQQLPQLLGGFGMWGAIAGATVAVAAAAATFIGLKSAAQELQDTLKAGEEGWERATSRAERYTSVLRAQGDLYGSAVAAGQRYRDGLRGEIENVISLTRYYGGLTDAMRATEQARLDREGTAATRNAGTLREQITGAVQMGLIGVGPVVGSDGGLVTFEKELGAVSEAMRQFRADGVVSQETVGRLIASLREGTQISGAYGESFRIVRNQLLDLMPEVARYEEMLKRLGIQQTLLGGGQVQGQALETARNLASQIGGRYQTREAANDNIAKLRAGLREATDPQDIARITSALHEQQVALLGLEGPLAGYMRSLQQAAAVARTMEGAERELAQAMAAADESARSAGYGQASPEEKARIRALVQERLNAQLNDYLVKLGQQAEADEVAAAAMEGGARAARIASDENKALVEALKYGRSGSAEYLRAVDQLSAGFGRARDAADELANAKALSTQAQELDLIREEVRLVAASANERERELAAFRERQKIRAELGDPDTASSQARIMGARQLADERRNLTLLQDSMTEAGRIGERAFERVGEALTDGFINGRTEALRLGSVLRGVTASAAVDLAKLAALNPLRNALLGGNLPTLSSVTTAMSGSAGSAGGSGGLLGNLSSAYSLGRGILSGGELVTGIGAIDAALSTTLWTTGNLAASTNAALAGLGAGVYGPAAPGAVAAAGATTTTLGGLLGGAGAGFAAGSLLNTLVGGKPVGGMVGSGAGALAGAALGSIIPGVGTLIGGLIGGAGGGLLGGLFGPGSPNPASSVQIGIDDNGQLVVVGSRSKHMSSAEGIAQTNEALAGLNSAVSSRGLSLRSSGGAVVGQTFQGNDTRFNESAQRDFTQSILASLTGGSGSVMAVVAREAARGAQANLDEAFSNIDWVRSVYEPLSNLEPALDAFETQVRGIEETFGAASARARELGLATDDLAENQRRQIQALQDARHNQIWDFETGLEVRRLRAGGQNEQADLREWEVTRRQQLEQARALYEGLGLASEDVNRRMLVVEQTLADERLSIVQSYANRAKQAETSAAQAATGMVTSLADYARSLAYGEGSTLSARDQLSVAERRFREVRDGAIAGDAGSVSALQQLSQDYLSAARGLYGSGAGYASARADVLSVLERFSEINPDTLTASIAAQQSQAQTEALQNEIGALREVVVRLLQETQQGNAIRRLVA